MNKSIKTLLALIIFASILLPINNAHLLQGAEANEVTYYYSDGSYKYTTSNPDSIPAWAYQYTFTVVPGATYYYSDGSYKWTTTNPDNIPTSQYGNTFTVVPGATYYYSDGSYKYTTSNPDSIPAWAYQYTFTVVPGSTYYYSDSSYKGTTTNPNSILTWLYHNVFTDRFNQMPSITLSSPVTNQTFSAVAGFNQMTLSGTVNDQDVGDVLTVKYNIDGGATQTVSGTVSANGTNQAFSTTTINVSGVAEGTHSLNVWVEDDKGGVSATTIIPFKMDKSGPTINAPSVTMNSTSQITVVPSASDPTVSGVTSSFAPTPYQYRRNGIDVGTWQAGNLVDTGLTANTQYAYSYKARDSVGNESAYSLSVSRYTQALNPTVVTAIGKTNNSITFSITNDSGNGNAPQHRLEVKLKGAGAAGSVINASDFNVSTTNRLVSGLSEGTEYEVWCITRNGDGVANSPVKLIDSITTNSPPLISVINSDHYKSTTPGHETIALHGRLWDADGDGVTVTAALNGVIKSVVVNPAPTTDPGSDNWILTWDVSVDSVPEGTYTGITITANDSICTPTMTNFTGNIIVDLTAPSDPTITVTPPSWTNGDVSVTISNIQDALSGVDHLEFSTDGGATPQNHASTSDLVLTLSTEGQHSITAKTVDKAGNESNVVAAIAYVDKTKPIISMSNVTEGMKYYTPKSPTYSVTDALSGVNTVAVTAMRNGVPFPWSNGEEINGEGSYSITINATDNAGNPEVSVFNFEIALPELPVAPTLTPMLNGEVKVDWPGVIGADRYKVFRDGVEVCDTDLLTFADTARTPNTQYLYRIGAYNQVGMSNSPDSQVWTLANAPINLQITNIVSDGLTLIWDPNGNPAGTEYFARCIETGQDSGWITDTQMVFNGLLTTESYNFEVKARNHDGYESVVSSVYGSIAAPPLDNVSLTPGENPGTVKITAPDLPPGAIRYEYKVQPGPFIPPPAVGDYFGGTEFTPPASIPANPGEHLGIAAVDGAGNIVQFVDIHVTPANVSLLDHLVVAPNPITIANGLTQQLMAEAHYTGGSVINITNTATYASDSTGVANIGATGLLTGVSEGTANITVTYGTQSLVVPVTVSPAIGVGLTIINTIAELNQGDTHQYIAQLNLSDGTVSDVTNTAVWSITDPAKATMANGLLTGISAGSVIISTSHSGQIAMTSVAIQGVAPPPSGGGGGGWVEPEPPPVPEPSPIVEPEIIQPKPEPLPEPEPAPEFNPVPVVEPQPVAKSNNSEQKGTIYGRVVDETGAPLAGLLVELHSVIRTTFTDSQGYYKFENVEPGEHHLYLRDKDRLIELAVAKIFVRPGMNRIESAFGGQKIANNVKVQVKAKAAGERIDFVISEEKLALIKPPVVKELPKPIEQIVTTATAAITVAGGGVGAFYLILLPMRRKYNVFIMAKGKPVEKHKIQAQRVVMINLTRQIRGTNNRISIQFGKDLLKQLSVMEGTIILHYENTQIAVFKISEPRKQLTAEIDVNSLETKWSA